MKSGVFPSFPRWKNWVLAGCAAAVTVSASGQALPTDPKELTKYFRDLRSRKDAESLLKLAAYYAAGHPELTKGTPDHARAMTTFKLAADAGNPEAQYRYAFYLERPQLISANSKKGPDFAQAVVYYTKAAEQEVAAAQLRLGQIYLEGMPGVDPNYDRAFSNLRKAAERGLPDAQRLLGECYRTGRGAERSSVEALKWYTIAAANEEEAAAAKRDTAPDLDRMKASEVEAAAKAAAAFVPK